MYILGIDQGGTKTTAIICDNSGNIFGTGKSQGACHQISGIDNAMARIDEAASEAATEACLSYENIELLSCGITGADWDYEYPLLQKALHRLTGIKNILVFNDAVIAFYGGTSRKFGVCICSGTATNVAVISPSGESFSYGFYVQVGHVGKAGLEAVFASKVGIVPETILTEAALSFFAVSNVDELLWQKSTGKIPKSKIKHFAPFVFNACDKQDTVSQNIVATFAHKCAAYAIAGMKQFHMEDKPCDVVLSGGIFKTKCDLLYKTLSEDIRVAAPNSNIINSYYEPVVGAVLLAIDNLYPNNPNYISQSILKNIEKSATKHKILRF